MEQGQYTITSEMEDKRGSNVYVVFIIIFCYAKFCDR